MHGVSHIGIRAAMPGYFRTLFYEAGTVNMERRFYRAVEADRGRLVRRMHSTTLTASMSAMMHIVPQGQT